MAGIIVGSVSVTVVPEIRNFTRDAKAKLVPEADKLGAELGRHIGVELRRSLQTELQRLPNVKLDADDRRVKAKVAGARRQIQDLGKETAKPQITPQLAQGRLDKIKVELGEVADRAYNVDFDANDKRLVAKMSLIKARLHELDATTSKPTLDLAGAFRAEAEIAKLDAEVDEFGHKRATAQLRVNTNNSERGIRRLFDLLIGFSPAIVQAGIIAGGVVAAVGSAVAVAGAGIGIVGIAAHGAASLMKSDLKQLKSDNAKLATAQAQLDNAKGPKARAAALKKVAEAQAAVNSLTKAMGPAEAQMLKDTDALTQSWHRWLRGTAIPGLEPIVRTFRGELPRLLKDITPLFESAARGIHGFELDAFKAFRSPFWQQFFDFLGKRAGPTIRAFGRILINSVTGLAGLIQALDPLGQHYVGTIEKLSARFANFGKGARGSSSFQAFLKYVRDNGPLISEFMKSLASFMVSFAKASAGVGVAELKALTSVLNAMAVFAAKHPQMAAMAVAVFTLSRAVKALKLVAIGGWIANLAKLGAAQLGIGAASSAAGAAGAAGGAAEGAAAGGLLTRLPALVGGLGATGAVALLLAPVAAGIVATLLSKNHPTLSGPGSRNPNGTPRTIGLTGEASNIANAGGHIVQPGSAAWQAAQLKASQATAENTAKIKENTGKGVGTAHPGSPGESSLFGATRIPMKVLISGDAVAAQKLLRVQKIVGGIPKNKDIRIGTPAVENVQAALANVILATHGLPPEKRIKVSAPGGNLTALSLLNISRAARGLPPVKSIHINSPGVTGALENINTLAHRMGLLPPKKSIATSVPGARAAILDMINLDRRAHGLPPLKRIPTTAPGADKAIQQLIGLARRAALLPPLKRINTSTPGAVKAYGQLNTLLHSANVLPKGKKIPTDVPGATKSILTFINLKRRADGLPPLKKIPTSAPGADHSIQQAIDLARKIGLIPKKHDTNINTPGYQQAHQNIQNIIDSIGRIPSRKSVTIDAVGNVRIGNTGFGAKAEGGLIRGPGGPRGDKIPGWLSDSEFVQPAHIVAREGVDKMEMLRRGKATIVPTQGFADGGIVINMKSRNLNRVATAGTAVETAAAKAADRAMQRQFASLGAGSGNVASWIPVVAAALAMLGQPTGYAPLWARTVIANESGGNPLAVNRYDRNWQNGTPSVGGNQVIGPTFAANAGPFANTGPFLYGVSVNRLANTYAALHYAIASYGSIANVPGIRSISGGGGYRPYANGGATQANVPMLVGERGPEVWTPRVPGYVTPNHELGGDTIVRVFIGNEEIRDIARVEVQREGNRQGQKLAAGRRVVR